MVIKLPKIPKMPEPYMDKLIMSKQEREQLVVFKQLDTGEITAVAAAEKLNISDRWVRKKLGRYRDQGDAGLIHKSRGKPSPNRWNCAYEALAIELLKSEWCGFGPTFLAEKLKELKGIKVSRETLRKIMIKEKLWVTGKRPLKHRRWRERKRVRGVLVQLDGSPHDWFEGRGPKCTLLVFIDDATSELLWLEFAASESFEGVASATKKYIKKDGRPVAFYVDYGSVFSVNTNNADRDKKTQFERIMSELLVEVIHARSPQAKGRVERANKTLQDRLVKEMRLANISSIESANAFIHKDSFMAKHNAKFAVEPAEASDGHRSLEGYDLVNIFCQQETRKVTNDFTIQYKGRVLQLEVNKLAIVRPKSEVTVCQHLDGRVTLQIRKNKLSFKEIGMRKIGKLSPVDWVNQENHESQENDRPGLPI